MAKAGLLDAPAEAAPDAAAAAAARWALALAAIPLIADAPMLGGIWMKAPPGPVRDIWCEALARHKPVRRLPSSADADALDGGLDLAATLAAGRPAQRPGLLAELGDGILLVPMAERLSRSLAARLAASLDERGPVVVLLDESPPPEPGEMPENPIPQSLIERLAIHLDLTGVRLPMAALLAGETPDLDPFMPEGDMTRVDDPAGNLAAAAVALGIASVRAPIHALRLAHAHASVRAPIHALRLAHAHARSDGRSGPAAPDLQLAAALVLGPRATRLPPGDAPQEPENDPPPPDEPPPPNPDTPPDSPDNEQQQPNPEDLTDLVLEAAAATIPPGVLDSLSKGLAAKNSAGGSAGAKLRSITSGRPAGVRAGAPGRGARLAIIETIKTAAPRQKLRPPRDDGRLTIRHDDLRIRRFVARAASTTIFAVDASGSAAFTRLAETKGAIELLLAQAYVKRAEVALVAFRGTEALLALPPTRSLARAKKELAALAAGGGTPIAAGLALARRVAETERGRGRTPLIVILTDGRANVPDASGKPPQEAALAEARALATTGIRAVFIDCAARPRPEGPALAAAMGAPHVPLPRLDAKAVVAAVEVAQKAIT
ncbi:VWA domain-containing protein [Polymorphobacter multimanifer]|uniref:VWA domain-containing protein n=1 Tax=Polymorphobacter multimanifer TaxID=1070431 RepID=UPI00166AB5EE|nr:VWA domain-containing protein [Polymorphobacter multimanifer]